MEYFETIVIDNEITFRPFTESEIKERQKLEVEFIARQAEATIIKSNKADLYSKLGITEDEAKLLLG